MSNIHVFVFMLSHCTKIYGIVPAWISATSTVNLVTDSCCLKDFLIFVSGSYFDKCGMILNLPWPVVLLTISGLQGLPALFSFSFRESTKSPLNRHEPKSKAHFPRFLYSWVTHDKSNIVHIWFILWKPCPASFWTSIIVWVTPVLVSLSSFLVWQFW